MNNAPKPTALREYEGDLSKGKNKAPLNEPTPITPIAPTPPEWLNDEGKKIWAELYPEFAAMSMLKLIDTMKFATYCDLTARYISLTIAINEEGEVTAQENSRGKLYKSVNPKLIARTSLWTQLKTLGELFGDSPAARVRLGRDMDKGSKDPLDAFLEDGE